MSTTPTSEASTKVDGEANDHTKSTAQRAWQRAKSSATAQDILIFLIAFRILDALSIRTFFQPDEYFQSLEPAWEIAFGKDSGAWVTWEWKYHLRSTIHPYIFAAVYRVAGALADIIHLSPYYRAELLIAAPKVLQAHFAAIGDYYTWRLGEKIYGHGSLQAWMSLALTVCSPWQWFCSTRTFSNSLEMTLTIVALESWPWQWSQMPKDQDQQVEGIRSEPSEEDEQGAQEPPNRLRGCLLLAALACILRPTNILIWAPLTCFTLLKLARYQKIVVLKWPRLPVFVAVAWPALLRATRKERSVFVMEVVFCGTAVLAVSSMFDWSYYQQLTFPPLKFLYFNIAQSLAVFYGRNPWHYYLSQGYPLLLTTYLPFAVHGLYDAIWRIPADLDNGIETRDLPSAIRYQLASISLIVPSVLSLIAHKEVRFIYPLLPILHVLAAPSAASFFRPVLEPPKRPLPDTPLSSAPSSPLLSRSFLSSTPSSPSSSKILDSSPKRSNKSPKKSDSSTTSSPKSSKILEPSTPSPQKSKESSPSTPTSSPKSSKILHYPSTISSSTSPQNSRLLPSPDLSASNPSISTSNLLSSSFSQLLPRPLNPYPSPPLSSQEKPSYLPPTITSNPYLSLSLLLILSLNISLALFTTQAHQPTPLTVLSYLRHQHENHYLTQPPPVAGLGDADTTMTVGFLMPCHSTPWRSHLVHPGIKAWALGCEPPVHIPPGKEREGYLDEADRFYVSPKKFMTSELGPAQTSPAGVSSVGGFFGLGGQRRMRPSEGLSLLEFDAARGAWDGKEGRKLWPHYLVFFQGLEGTVRDVVGEMGLGYAPCWRGWNSFGHDDWRRKGDVVVWCMRGDGTKVRGREREREKRRGRVGEGAVRVA